MPDFLTAPFANGQSVVPEDVLIRLVVALLMGAGVSWIYRRTRRDGEASASFPVTLVLLSVLIAMVTQVIGDNVARAFSLVGALSIVRFRTVVRDTQDTAYVIFSVVVGMAIGAKNPWVAVIGIVVVGAAALFMATRGGFNSPAQPSFRLNLRIGIGHDLEKLLGPVLDTHFQDRQLASIGTAQKGVALDVIYQARFRPAGRAEELVKALNLIEGVQSVQLDRHGLDED